MNPIPPDRVVGTTPSPPFPHEFWWGKGVKSQKGKARHLSRGLDIVSIKTTQDKGKVPSHPRQCRGENRITMRKIPRLIRVMEWGHRVGLPVGE
ncbi:MAG: hypothetical protein C7B43_20200 [Sulfobacillus benefaciens]|uniref:Uncharacterized protein n=1 Tax=Sulfobacillus benefaciens TaxID=453960 RepID=A0A2T2WM55_9FIRM|nr:MAG: hypothetical protein C7B43_20200 [Sulfobacillus benefaciens]